MNSKIANSYGKVTTSSAIIMIEKARALLSDKITKNIDPMDKALLTQEKFVLPNLQKHSNMLEWAGINFGEGYTILLQKALRKLAVFSGASSLRLFGKIYGT